MGGKIGSGSVNSEAPEIQEKQAVEEEEKKACCGALPKGLSLTVHIFAKTVLKSSPKSQLSMTFLVLMFKGICRL